MKWSFLLFSSFLCLQAIAQYPATGNKMRLGWQTTGDGLVYRGAIGDTATLDPSGINNAWMLLDTANGNLYAYRAKAWRLVSGGGGGGGVTMPFDSVTFNVNETDASLRELKYSEEKGYLQYGGLDSVQIPLLPGIWYVRNDTSVTIPKGMVVRATGTLGASGRIKVKHMIANGSIDAMYILGIAMQDIAVGADGYVMTQGKIRQVNTQAYSEGAVLYADVDTLGGLTQTEPTGSNLKLPIAFVVHSASNGTLAVRVSPGTYLRDLHDAYITSPDSNASLYYNAAQGVWRDTGAAVLVADTSAMLSSYISNADTSVFARDFQISGTANYLAKFTGSNAVGNSGVFESGGNVGIGITTVPFAKLNVNNSIRITDGGTGAGSNTYGLSQNLYIGNDGGGVTMQYNASNGIDIYTYDAGWNRTFTIDKTGRFGIGEPTPARILHIVNTGAIRIPVGNLAQRGTSDNGDIRVRTDTASMEYYSGAWRTVAPMARVPQSGLANRFSKFDANGLLDTSAVLVQANGRIGIWNTPTASDSVLTVTGGIYTTNGVRVNNGISSFLLTPSGSVPTEIATLGLTHTATSAESSPGGIVALALTAQTPSTSFTYASQGINAARIRAFHNASSTLVQLNGVNLTARNLGAGTVTLANGGNFVVGNSGASATGLITNARGGTFTLENAARSRITNLYGAYFILTNANDTAGSIGNIYGTYLEPITGGSAAAVSVTNLYGYYIPSGWSAKATNKWSFYADDANAPLYSAGKIGAGVTTPQNALDVEGGAVIGATYSGTNTAPANGLLVQGETRIAMTADSGDYSLQVSGNTKLMGNLARKKPVTIAAATYTVLSDDSWLICNHTAQITITLPTAANSVGRELMIKYVAGGGATVISNATNVSPIVGGALTNIILPATAGSWVTLVCDGANWIIMQKG